MQNAATTRKTVVHTQSVANVEWRDHLGSGIQLMPTVARPQAPSTTTARMITGNAVTEP